MQVVRFYACTIYLNKLTSALSSKEISLKNDHHCGGRGQFNGIYCTVFKSPLFCSRLARISSPHEESHMQIYSESTETHFLSMISFRQIEVI